MAPAEDVFSSKVSLNVLTNVVRTVIMALVGLIMVPYYLGEFGLSVYAIIPLATTITNYFLIVSDSLSNAFSRYMVMAVQSGDMDGANRVFTTSVLGMGRVIVMLLPVVTVIAFASPYIFNIGPSAALDVQLMFLLIAVSSLLISFTASLGSVYMAYNKMYITYISRAVQTLSQVATVVLLFFLEDPSLTLIGWSYLVSAAIMLVIMLAYLRKVCPTLRFSRTLYDGRLIRDMGGLGAWSTISEVGNLFFIQASLIVVNVMLGSDAQGSFSIAANVIMMVHTVSTSVAVSVAPLAYRQFVQGDTDGMMDTLRIFSKFIGVMMAFPLVFLLAFCPQVLELWLGAPYHDICEMLYVMIPAEIAISAVSALMQVPIVFKAVRPAAMATCAAGVANVVASVVILILTDWGVLSVCAVWAVSMLVLKVGFYPHYTDRLVGGGIRRYLLPIVECYAVFALLLVLFWVLTRFFIMPVSWFAVLGLFFVGFAAFFVVVMRCFFNRGERATIVTYLPGFVQKVIRS